MRTRRILKWAGTLLLVGLCAFAALLFVPWLGATGFWDPWEPHYGEVARDMIARGDYIHPWWESAYFFSNLESSVMRTTHC